MNYEEAIIELLKKHIPGDIDSIDIKLEVPPDRKLGDFAFPCFALAKHFKKAPQMIAHDLAPKFNADFLDDVKATGPYINFFLNKKNLAADVLGIIAKEKMDYGKGQQKQKIMIEFSSPNTNKPLHLGHVRNMVLGDSVSRMFAFLGNYVVKACLVNDRGVHICKSMLAYKRWGKKSTPKKAKMKGDLFVGSYYILFAQKLAEHPELEDEAQEMLRQWEAGDEDVVALWKQMNAWVYDGFDVTYKKLGIDFDTFYYESNIYAFGKEAALDGLKRGILEKKDGAVYAMLEDVGLPDKVLVRSDGTTIYMTQDLYLAQKKFQDYKLDKSVIVVGSEQDLHFKQLFAILKKLGNTWADGCYHLSYGMVNLPEGKMKSREGTVVDADGLIEEMEELAAVEIQKRQKLNTKELHRRAHAVGLAALKFHLLKVDPVKEIVYNPKESLSFEGETGPYVQYTYARIASIIRKSSRELDKVDVSVLGEKGLALARTLEMFGAMIEDAARHYKPSLICRYLLDLCQDFNSYYHDVPVLKAENDELVLARLYLLSGVKHVLKNGLDLLGIEVLEEM